jgi:hypothetical protein
MAQRDLLLLPIRPQPEPQQTTPKRSRSTSAPDLASQLELSRRRLPSKKRPCRPAGRGGQGKSVSALM